MTGSVVDLRLRCATPADETWLLDWRNEDLARKASFNTQLISPDEHHRWFRKMLCSERCRIFIVELQGASIGSVRFHWEGEAEAEVSICLDPQYRGQGLSVPAMRNACSSFFKEAMIRSIVAHVKEWNQSSRRLFLAAGFIKEGEERRNGDLAVVFRLVRSD